MSPTDIAALTDDALRIEIAKAIQEGAMAYLKRQFRTILVILVPVALVVFFTSTAVTPLPSKCT